MGDIAQHAAMQQRCPRSDGSAIAGTRHSPAGALGELRPATRCRMPSGRKPGPGPALGCLARPPHAVASNRAGRHGTARRAGCGKHPRSSRSTGCPVHVYSQVSHSPSAGRAATTCGRRSSRAAITVLSSPSPRFCVDNSIMNGERRVTPASDEHGLNLHRRDSSADKARPVRILLPSAHVAQTHSTNPSTILSTRSDPHPCQDSQNAAHRFRGDLRYHPRPHAASQMGHALWSRTPPWHPARLRLRRVCAPASSRPWGASPTEVDGCDTRWSSRSSPR